MGLPINFLDARFFFFSISELHLNALCQVTKEGKKKLDPTLLINDSVTNNSTGKSPQVNGT